MPTFRNPRSSALAALLLGACATGTNPAGEYGAIRPTPAAASGENRPEPIALAALEPESRTRAELERLAPARMARWLLPPDRAVKVARVELAGGFSPLLSGVSLYQTPEPAQSAGLCYVRGDYVRFRVRGESSLTDEQSLDPPLQPYEREPFVRWKAVGSTLAGRPNTERDCEQADSARDWFDAPSEEALLRALSAVERAQHEPGRIGLGCRQLVYDEAKREYATAACPAPKEVLARLTPDLIRRVVRADCAVEATGPLCLAIEYHVPIAPGDTSHYVVTTADERRPARIDIAQVLLPAG